MREQPPFPFFVATALRPLTSAERAIARRLVENASEHHRTQIDRLVVVGRCGCGKCPTIFFEPHQEGDREADVASYAGPDAAGGLVAAVLLEKQGTLSQLEFFSVDGHDPWEVPAVESLKPY